jgi:hypothetical protein
LLTPADFARVIREACETEPAEDLL